MTKHGDHTCVDEYAEAIESSIMEIEEEWNKKHMECETILDSKINYNGQLIGLKEAAEIMGLLEKLIITQP